ncbi:MAG: kinase/pyrophosphorylase, partial [Bacteroidales bacterium]|nr:kinase/pyrophosphorylase [Bacteroidales bacterium]
MRKIYILSDGTGRTASYALEAAMVQFQEMKDETKIELFPDVRTSQQIDQIVEKASKEEALIIY